MYRIIFSVSVILVSSGCGRKPQKPPQNIVTKTTPGQTIQPTVKPTSATKQIEMNPLINWQRRSEQIERSDPKMKRVAITFDGDWDASATYAIVESLKRHHVKGTFFITGHFCHQFPRECKALADAGMELGSHSYTHPMFSKISDTQIRRQLEETEAAMRQRFGKGAKPLFRFPCGESDDRSRRVVAKEGFQAIYWSLDSLDAYGEEKSSNFVRQRVINRVKSGDIVLMHLSAHGTANALNDILDHIQNQGLKVVPVSEMMKEGVMR